MKNSMTMIAALAAISAFGAEPADNQGAAPSAAPAARRIPIEERRLIHDAGMVEKQEKGPALCVVDFREAGGDISGVISKIEAFTRLTVKTEKRRLGEGECPVKASFALLGKERGAIIAITDDAASPSMSVFPEDGVVVVNVRKLSDGLPEEGATAVLEGRMARELWRATAFALGGYETEYKCVVKNIRSPKELDALPQNTCPPVSEKISEGASKLGLARKRMVTYSSAVLGGFAPEPKTEAQKKLVEYYKANGRLPATNDTSKASAPAKE